MNTFERIKVEIDPHCVIRNTGTGRLWLSTVRFKDSNSVNPSLRFRGLDGKILLSETVQSNTRHGGNDVYGAIQGDAMEVPSGVIFGEKKKKRKLTTCRWKIIASVFMTALYVRGLLASLI